MPNRAAHAILGGIFGVGAYLAYAKLKGQDPSVAGIIETGVVGAGAAILPDILEPAIDPNHRSFFHSWAALGVLASAAVTGVRSPKLLNEVKPAVLAAAAGYGSHLLADATTPKSLPLIW
jgi:inner membrane protein